MKKNYSLILTLGALLFSATGIGQITLTQWNFNGATAQTVPGGTSSPLPVIGAGTAAFVGGTTATTPTTDFPSGQASGGSSDPVMTTPNTDFAWGSTGYAVGGENKQRGVQFNVSTANYAGITFTFDQRLSNTANNTYVVQYTTDRSAASPVWVDAQTFTFTPAATGTGDVWYNLRSVDLSGVTALNNNDMAAFRIVSAFDPATNDYRAATSTSTYSPTGTARYDMVTVSAANLLGIPGHIGNGNSFKMYPNPSNKQIVNFDRPYDIEVYSITGKQIFKGENVTLLDTREFASGVYLIKNQHGAVQKLIVN